MYVHMGVDLVVLPRIRPLKVKKNIRFCVILESGTYTKFQHELVSIM